MASAGDTAPCRRSQRPKKIISYVDQLEQLGSDEDAPLLLPATKRAREVDGIFDPASDDLPDGPRIVKKSRKTPRPFRFLDLPAEIRNEIYTLALIDPNNIMLSGAMVAHRRTVKRTALYEGFSSYGSVEAIYKLHSPKESPTHAQLSPQLLSVCKQINQEALTILYGQPIILADTIALHNFVMEIGLNNQQYLNRLVIKSWGQGKGAHKAANHYALAALQNVTNLKELCLDCHLGWQTSVPKRAAMILYCSAHHFLEQFGRQHGRKDAALDVLRLNVSQFPTLRHANFTGNYYNNLIDQHKNEVEVTAEQNMQHCKDELRKLLLAH